MGSSRWYHGDMDVNEFRRGKLIAEHANEIVAEAKKLKNFVYTINKLTKKEEQAFEKKDKLRNSNFFNVRPDAPLQKFKQLVVKTEFDVEMAIASVKKISVRCNNIFKELNAKYRELNAELYPERK